MNPNLKNTALALLAGLIIAAAAALVVQPSVASAPLAGTSHPLTL
jgi:hypothetical protein